MNQKKWRNYIQSKGLDPKMNRKKFGSILFGTTILVFLVFVIRFVYIVGVGKVGTTLLDKKTQDLYQGSSVVKAKRGTIYDRNGEPIAEDATSYSLYVILDESYVGLYDQKTKKPEILYLEKSKKEAVADLLNVHLKIPKDEAMTAMNPGKNESGNDITQVEFGNKGNQISLETKNKIEEDLKKQDIRGIYFTEHPDRIYKNGIFSPYLVGYVRRADEEDESKGLVGQMGVEQTFNEKLSGTDGKIRYQKDNKQNPLPGSTVVEKEAIDGEDIYLTIDRGMQARMEDLLDEIFEEFEPEDMTATLMEAKTGNILAASQRPAFNPETLEGLDNKGQWQNLLLELPFEPGSTMKVFTVAAAIETGNFNPNATFTSGSIQVDDRKISDHNPDGIGTITYRQALAWSSNVGMVKLQQAMGPNWQDYMHRFKFGEKTNVDLPNEKEGNIQNETTVDRAMTSYGQAMATTPLQMLQGFTALTNEGKMLKPNFISKFVEADGTETKIQPEIVGEPIKASTANQVLDMMTDVVDDPTYGTGKAYALDGYKVAAKTGTAEINEKGNYLKDQYLYSVVQIAPAENPEYIMYVTIRKPPIGKSASEMLSKVSNSLLERALNIDVTNQLVETTEE